VLKRGTHPLWGDWEAGPEPQTKSQAIFDHFDNMEISEHPALDSQTKTALQELQRAATKGPEKFDRGFEQLVPSSTPQPKNK